MYSVPFQPCPRMEEWLCFLLDEPFHGWWLHHVPHLHAGALLLLAAGAVGALRGPFAGSDGGERHGQGQQRQQGQRHRAHGREHARHQLSCQLQGWKALQRDCHQEKTETHLGYPRRKTETLYEPGFTSVSSC